MSVPGTTFPHRSPATLDLLQHESIALYGCGEIGRDVCEALRESGHSVKYFLDAHPELCSKVCDLEVMRPDSTRIAFDERAATIVIVSIFNRDVYISRVVDQLHALGWGRVLTLFDVFPLLAARLGNRFWLTNPSQYDSWSKDIEAASSVRADEQSRSLFNRTVRFRLTGDSSLVQPDVTGEQYFPVGLPPMREPARVIDCGAFDGDTVRALARSAISTEAVAAFEPDPANYALLRKSLVSSFSSTGDFTAQPYAVWHDTQMLRFHSGRGESSAIAVDGGTTIQGVALDQVLASFRPSFIKMDIEGAEVSALLGAEQLIRQNTPDLAICVYHCPEHLWQIPLLIHCWNLGYSLYLRAHAFNGFDMVLYARRMQSRC